LLPFPYEITFAWLLYKFVLPPALHGCLRVAAIHTGKSAQWTGWEVLFHSPLSRSLFYVYEHFACLCYVVSVVFPSKRVPTSFVVALHWFRWPSRHLFSVVVPFGHAERFGATSGGERKLWNTGVCLLDAVLATAYPPFLLLVCSWTLSLDGAANCTAEKAALFFTILPEQRVRNSNALLSLGNGNAWDLDSSVRVPPAVAAVCVAAGFLEDAGTDRAAAEGLASSAAAPLPALRSLLRHSPTSLLPRGGNYSPRCAWKDGLPGLLFSGTNFPGLLLPLSRTFTFFPTTLMLPAFVFRCHLRHGHHATVAVPPGFVFWGRVLPDGYAYVFFSPCVPAFSCAILLHERPCWRARVQASAYRFAGSGSTDGLL